jgi:hypothetical protein
MVPLQQTPSTSNIKSHTQRETVKTTNYTWQQIKRRKRSNETTETTTVGNPIPINTQNRYEELSMLSDEDMQTNETTEIATNTKNENLRKSRLPPIYIYGVTNYHAMVEHLATTVEEEQYYCKALSNETIKINVTTPDSYWKLIKQLQQEKIVHHTYQIREEREYRVVIRNLHHSVAMGGIKEEIEK